MFLGTHIQIIFNPGRVKSVIPGHQGKLLLKAGRKEFPSPCFLPNNKIKEVHTRQNPLSQY